MESVPFVYPEVLSAESELLEIRRYLHENPEIAFEEFTTAAYIVSYLEKLGLEVIKEIAKTGVVGLLRGSFPGPTILIRADMDALPVQEETDLPFKSKIPGNHHGCGHDGHVAILLMAAKIITEKFAGKIKGNIKFLFQPAEEIVMGAHEMITDPKYPVLENPEVDKCFGLHVWTLEEVGKVELNAGFFSSFNSGFTVKVKGVGGHGAAPHYAKDPIFVAAQVMQNFYEIPARNLNPCGQNTLTVGCIHAGKVDNVIPSECEFAGTFRCVKESDKDALMKRMEEIVQGFSVAFGMEIELKACHGGIGIYNHPKETKEMMDVCGEIVGRENISDLKFGLYGEDFSMFTKEKPGAFLLLGAAPENSIKENKIAVHHHPKFTFNEDCLKIGVSIWVKLVEKLLI